MNGMNLTTSEDISSAIPQHFLAKKKKVIILPDGTELSEEDYNKMDERRWWSKAKKRLGQNRK